MGVRGGVGGRRRHQDDLFLFPLIDVLVGKSCTQVIFPDYKIKNKKRHHANSLSGGVWGGEGGMNGRGRRGSFESAF